MNMKKDFQENLKKYAELIVAMGVNVSKGHTIVLQISADQYELARLITAAAYEKGAAEVIVQWTDEFVQKETLTHADEERITNIPQYKVDQIQDWIEKGASRISVVSSGPDTLKSVPADRIAKFQTANGKASLPLRKVTQANKVSWLVAAAAGEAWAEKVFPHLGTKEEKVAALWDQIFKTTRIYAPDPIEAWEEHVALLSEKAKQLNNEQFDALHYSAPGTDLTVGLPKNHIWEGADSFNVRGERFVANMPTEEVFTAPDARRIDGIVSSTKPLSYAGTIISGIQLTFKDGKVVEAHAEQGEEHLKQLLETDEGAKSLGEAALVPHQSPISQSGIIFYNTLFDENASNHLALGSAYAFSVQGGTEMNEEELKAAGLNRSQVHVDFMIGSEEMNIDGIRKDGSRIPIFRNGNWA